MFTSNSKVMNWRMFVAAAVLFGACFLVMPSARADIVEVEAATGCPGSVGGGLCNGFAPFDLNTLVSGGITNVGGTEKFVVTDTVGSFSFVYNGSSGDNGSCQINGGAKSFFNACTGVNSDGTGFSLGHDDTNHPGMDPPTTITFTALPGKCTVAKPCTFDLGFVSWQGLGASTPTIVPEPGTLSLLATGLFGLVGFARRKLNP
jgi:PEP-CTERM motif-containing protein